MKQTRSRASPLSRVFLFLAGNVWQAGRWVFLLVVVSTTLNGLAPMATIWVGKEVLDSVIRAVRAGWNSTDTGITYRWLGLQLLVLMGEVLVQRSNAYLVTVMGRRLSLRISRAILEKASALDLATFEDPECQDKITRARTLSQATPVRVVQRFQGVVAGAITSFSMGALVASLSPALLGVMVVVCVPLLVVLVRYSERQFWLQFHRTEDMRKAQYLAGVMTTRHYVPEIINLGLWSHFIRKWSGLSQTFCDQDVRLARRQNLAQLGAHVAMAASEVGAMGYILYLGMRTLSLSVGEITMYARAFSQGLQSLRTSVEGLSGIYEDVLYFSNVADFHQLQPRLKNPPQAPQVPAPIEAIELQNVSFHYPGTSHAALKDISLCFRRAQSTLLVGTNGAGKTTLIKLLMRLYDPDEGRILINGTDVREFDLESVHRAMGAVFQEYSRFATSAGENIGYGWVSDLGDMGKIKAAAQRAKAQAFIDRLPHQYDTILTRQFKDGQELSLGQWQRICLARLFMKNAPVLIFDEPTASLDVETEVHLLNEIAKLAREKLCLLVSHRAFRHGIADQIVVLKDGRVAESGRYEDLVHHNGEFARLHRLYHGVPPNAAGARSEGTAAASLPAH